jgi:p21-activated kinase 1
MDQENSTAFSRFRRSSSKLHKEPPQANSSRALRGQHSNASLKRHPSAPVYPRSHAAGSREHLRTRSNAYGSSSSSLDQNSAGPSPVLTSSEFNHSQSRPSHTGHLSLTHRTSEEFFGTPFDARGMLNVLEETVSPTEQKQPQQQQRESSFRRPPLLHSYNTSPDPRTLRQSASFTALNPRMDTALPQIQDVAPNSKRNSDDGNPSKARKKGGFSNFMNSMLGSPRNIKISAPENPVHVTHVGYDNQTGQFTVRSHIHIHHTHLATA